MDIKHATITRALFALALLPGAALADEHCKFSQPKALELELAGAKAVVFQVNSHDLKLQATPGARATLSGRACASSQDLLGQLSLTQEKVGDKLVVRLERESRSINLNFGSSYAWLDIGGTLPDDVMVQLKVGSGDATLAGAQAMSADVGSGDVKARGIKGLATAAVGSGDIELDDVGALHVVSIGSGDVRIDGVRGDARVGSIGRPGTARRAGRCRDRQHRLGRRRCRRRARRGRPGQPGLGRPARAQRRQPARAAHRQRFRRPLRHRRQRRPAEKTLIPFLPATEAPT